MKTLLTRLAFFAALPVAFAVGFISRGAVASSPTVVAQQSHEERFPLLTEAVDYIDHYFIKEKPNPKIMEYALIRAYLTELHDPYTMFIEPVVAASESDALAGRYGGIGVDLQRNEQGDFVLYPFADGPAAKAGVRDGDIIIAINDVPLDLASSMDMVRQALRGEIVEGAGVTLQVRNFAETEERDYFILFGEILEPSVTWRFLLEAPEIGYIHITGFTSRTPEEFAQAVAELRKIKVSALVLDLRNNYGGMLHESVVVAGEFLDGQVIYIEKHIEGEVAMNDAASGLMLDLPLVVLVNSQTASAAEIVAGAIQAYHRGILIGQTTYGKGSIQNIFPLADQSFIHVTTALWFTPDKKPLDGAGLSPDISMIPDVNGRDVELGEAVRYLRQQLTG